MKSRLNKLLIVLTITAVGFWFIGINEPFVGSYGANLNYFTLAAKNFIRFGYWRLKFLPTYYSGGDLSSNPDFYLHHPVLYYTLISLPFVLFGFHNWVVSVIPIFFSLLTIFWLYKIALFLWNKRVALWSMFLTSVFPIMTVFSKQTIFEIAILSLLLAVYYYYLLFQKTKKQKYLFLMILFTFFAVLIDWGGAYYFFPFLILYKLLLNSKEKRRAVIAYGLTVFFGLLIFLLQIYLYKRNFDDLINAVLARQINLELFSLPYPLLRLFITTAVRILIYFTPLSFLGFFIFFREKSVKKLTFLFFLIFGMVNLIVLPAATFGHIYFLLYFLPFFALTLAKVGEKLELKNIKVATVFALSIFFFSFFITLMKWQQIKKQVWRYQAAYDISSQLVPYEVIAVYGFPGDIFEQYFFHPTIPLKSYEEVVNFLTEKPTGTVKVVFACWGECGSEDYEFINNLPFKIRQFDKAWLIENTQESKISLTDSLLSQIIDYSYDFELVIKIYRLIRDFLKVGQL